MTSARGVGGRRTCCPRRGRHSTPPQLAGLAREQVPASSVAQGSDSQPVMLDGPSMCIKFIQIFSALPSLNTILGATVALMGFSWPSCSTTQLAVCGGTQSLKGLLLVTAATMTARLTLSSIEQRASPKPHASSAPASSKAPTPNKRAPTSKRSYARWSWQGMCELLTPPKTKMPVIPAKRSSPKASAARAGTHSEDENALCASATSLWVPDRVFRSAKNMF